MYATIPYVSWVNTYNCLHCSSNDGGKKQKKEKKKRKHEEENIVPASVKKSKSGVNQSGMDEVDGSQNEPKESDATPKKQKKNKRKSKGVKENNLDTSVVVNGGGVDESLNKTVNDVDTDNLNESVANGDVSMSSEKKKKKKKRKSAAALDSSVADDTSIVDTDNVEHTKSKKKKQSKNKWI